MRVAITQVFHEANAFAPLPVTVDDFKRRHYLFGPAVRDRFAADSDWLSGVMHGFDEAGDEVTFGLCTACLPGGTMVLAAYREIVDALLHELRAILARGPLDIVVVALHGALLVEQLREPEADIVALVRTLVGPETVIAVTLDFHANVNPSMQRHADVIVAGQEYPHVDTFARGLAAARLARQAVRTPLRTWSFSLPIRVPLPNQSTFPGQPFAGLVAAATQVQSDLGAHDVTMVGGFAYGDADFVGMTVLVVTDRPELAVLAYRQLAAHVWKIRESLVAPIPPLDRIWPEIVRRARLGRVILADVADNPGSGGAGNETAVLHRLVGEGIPFASGVHVDPDAALAARDVGAGRIGRFVFGTRATHPGSRQLEIEARVERTGEISYRNGGTMMQGARLDGGLGAVLYAGNGHILVATERIQAYDTEAFASQGVELGAKAIVALKTAAHFRASFAPLACAGIVMVDAGGWAPPGIQSLPYRQRAHPCIPLDAMSKMEWERRVDAEIFDRTKTGT